MLLSLLVLVTGLAQAFDLHDEAGCADTGNAALADESTPARGDVPDLHASGCCFGSMVLTLPTSSTVTSIAVNRFAIGPATARPPSWHSDSPERPPRS
jgi:hypothetical protein